MSEPASRQARIVAGVDGSPESVHALRWAVRQAGYGGLTDTLLGSVSTYCVHHAPGPVTVVRPAKRPH